MANRNIQMKKKNNDVWDNLFPITLNENVYNKDGLPLNEVIDSLNQEIDTEKNNNEDRFLNVNDKISSLEEKDIVLNEKINKQKTDLLLETRKIKGYDNKVIIKNEHITGFAVDKKTSLEVGYASSLVNGNKTYDLLAGIAPYGMFQDFTTYGETELHLLNKPNSFVLKIDRTRDSRFVLDVRRNENNLWLTNPIASKTKFNFIIENEFEIEDYGVSQGLTTDNEYLYTSNNRLDKNSYHVHKRLKDGTFIQGITLDEGYNHPCGMTVVGGYLYVPANDYPNESSNHRVFVIDTTDMTIVDRIDFIYNQGGGISGIDYKDGYFYGSDWQIENHSNIVKFDTQFNQIDSKPIDCLRIQGIAFSGNKLYASTNEDDLLQVFYEHNLMTRIEDYEFYNEIEGEDLCITEDGTILHGDVNTIREYKIPAEWNNRYMNNEYYRFTILLFVEGGNTRITLYINGVEHGSQLVSGLIKNDPNFGLFINGNGTPEGNRRTSFYVKALGVHNDVLVPTKNINEVFSLRKYNELYIDTSLYVDTAVDISPKKHVITSVGDKSLNVTNRI